MNILNDDDLDGANYTDGNTLSSATAKTNASINVEGSLSVAKNILIGDSKAIYFGNEKTKILDGSDNKLYLQTDQDLIIKNTENSFLI